MTVWCMATGGSQYKFMAYLCLRVPFAHGYFSFFDSFHVLDVEVDALDSAVMRQFSSENMHVRVCVCRRNKISHPEWISINENNRWD